MDIEKIQKLNMMAQNLKRHNIVLSKEDAITRAEDIYGRENSYSREGIVGESDEMLEMKKDVRKLTFALRDAINEINDLKVQVSKLQRELNDVRVNPTPARRQHVEAEPKADRPIMSPEHKSQMQEKLVEAEPVEDKPAAPIDRNGIAPSDVSIDKFFYFGQK